MSSVLRLKRDEYIHVLDNNNNLTKCVLGPLTFTRMDHQQVVVEQTAFIALPPQTYCRICNPVTMDGGKVVENDLGEAEIQYGDEEVRVNNGKNWTVPFPLYPGEVLKQEGKESPIQKLTVVAKNKALRLRCERDFVDSDGVAHKAGDEYLFEGPRTYIPSEKVSFVNKVNATVIKPNQALKLRAIVDFTDRNGNARKGGSEWLVRQEGAYLPSVEEEITKIEKAYVITERDAIEVEAIITHEDYFGKKRLSGEKWLVTIKDTAAYIPEVCYCESIKTFFTNGSFRTSDFFLHSSLLSFGCFLVDVADVPHAVLQYS